MAVEISAEVREFVRRRIEFLRAEFSNFRVGWEKTEKLHLTLKFLGELEESRLPDLLTATEKAVQTIEPFELTIENSGAFPPRGAARVLWLGVKDPSGALQQLNKRLEDECFAVGFVRETRAFKPHLTIARLKEPNQARELVNQHLQTDFPAISFWVNQISVFESRLTPLGSNYFILANQMLQA